MYLSFIRPILQYADVLWDGCANENETCIEKFQLEAARLVSGLTRSTSTNKIYWDRLENSSPASLRKEIIVHFKRLGSRQIHKEIEIS